LAAGPQERPSIYRAAVLPNGSRQCKAIFPEASIKSPGFLKQECIHTKKRALSFLNALTKLAAGPQESPSIHLAAVLPNGSRAAKR